MSIADIDKELEGKIACGNCGNPVKIGEPCVACNPQANTLAKGPVLETYDVDVEDCKSTPLDKVPNRFRGVAMSLNYGTGAGKPSLTDEEAEAHIQYVRSLPPNYY